MDKCTLHYEGYVEQKGEISCKMRNGIEKIIK